MTTARDMIADVLYELGFDNSVPIADQQMTALLSASDSVRQELAGLLNPWRLIETAPSGELWCFWKTCGQQMVAQRLDDKWFDWEGNEVSEPTHWFHLPAPPKEDKA